MDGVVCFTPVVVSKSSMGVSVGVLVCVGVVCGECGCVVCVGGEVVGVLFDVSVLWSVSGDVSMCVVWSTSTECGVSCGDSELSTTEFLSTGEVESDPEVGLDSDFLCVLVSITQNAV